MICLNLLSLTLCKLSRKIIFFPFLAFHKQPQIDEIFSSQRCCDTVWSIHRRRLTNYAYLTDHFSMNGKHFQTLNKKTGNFSRMPILRLRLRAVKFSYSKHQHESAGKFVVLFAFLRILLLPLKVIFKFSTRRARFELDIKYVLLFFPTNSTIIL